MQCNDHFDQNIWPTLLKFTWAYGYYLKIQIEMNIYFIHLIFIHLSFFIKSVQNAFLNLKDYFLKTMHFQTTHFSELYFWS